MAIQMQVRRDTAANWTSANPILASGEFGVELGATLKFKIGDGTNAWNSLVYASSGTGGLNYVSTWNATTNTPSLVSSVGVQGNYYVVSVSGTTNLDGITDWVIGDWAIYNGTFWQKIDQTNTVSSVHGRVGDVTGAYDDYDSDKISIKNDGVTSLNSVKDLIDTQHSTGVVGSGGLISDAGSGDLTLAAATIALRTSNSDTAELKLYSVAGATLTPTDNSYNYVYAEYNAGSPRYIVTTSARTDTNTNVLIGRVYREGVTQHINQEAVVRANDNIRRVALRFVETLPFQRKSGANISEIGTRNIAISPGEFWECTNKFSTNAFDSSGADTFTYAYKNGAGGWTYQTSQTQVNNTQYDNNSGTLQTLSAGRYGIAWVYLETDSDVVVLFGEGNYTSQQAIDAPQPSSTPPRIQATGRLVGKIIVQKSDSTFTSVMSAFTSVFETGTSSDHNQLTGLQGGTTSEYYHLTSAQHTPLTAIAGLAVTDNNFIVGNGTTWVAESGATVRTSLGATTTGSNLFTLADPSAITFLRVNADNTVTALSASDFRTAIGAIGGTTKYFVTFDATTSWGTAAGGYYTITVTAATHGCSTTPTIQLSELDTTNYNVLDVDRIQINASGDVAFRVPETPDGRFAGRVVII